MECLKKNYYIQEQTNRPGYGRDTVEQKTFDTVGKGFIFIKINCCILYILLHICAKRALCALGAHKPDLASAFGSSFSLWENVGLVDSLEVAGGKLIHYIFFDEKNQQKTFKTNVFCFTF